MIRERLLMDLVLASVMVLRGEGGDVDREAHCVITGMIGMQVIPWQLGELAVGQEFRLHVARGRIERGRVKVLHSVKQTGSANKIIEDLAIGVMPGSVVALVDATDAQRRGHGRTVHLDPPRMEASDDVLIASFDLRYGVIGSKVVDALQPNHVSQSR